MSLTLHESPTDLAPPPASVCSPRVPTGGSDPPARMPQRRCGRRPDPDLIFVPEEARAQPFACLTLSARLVHVLRWQGIRRLGDLHGRSLLKFREFRNCGRKTQEELLNVILAVHGTLLPAPGTAPARPACFSVQDPALDLEPERLPVSGRLTRALNQMGIRRLGDLRGRLLSELLEIPQCGKATLDELNRLIARAVAAEFQIQPFSVSQISMLLRTLDDLIENLPVCDRKILLLRLGGDHHRVRTLAAIAKRCGYLIGKVQNTATRSIRKILWRGGPRLAAWLQGIADTCRDLVCPLTPALLELWLGSDRSRLGLRPILYVRLLARLNPDIPAWPRGHESLSCPSGEFEGIVRAVRRLLETRGEACPCREAFGCLIADGTLQGVTADSFFAALHRADGLEIRFPQPDQPEVALLRRD